jgi:hypothetical protein
VSMASTSASWTRRTLSLTISYCSRTVFHRTDRSARGGGTAILVRSGLDHYAVPVSGLQHLEATAIHLVLANGPVKWWGLTTHQADPWSSRTWPTAWAEVKQSWRRAISMRNTRIWFLGCRRPGLAHSWLRQQKLPLYLRAGLPYYNSLPTKCHPRCPWYCFHQGLRLTDASAWMPFRIWRTYIFKCPLFGFIAYYPEMKVGLSNHKSLYLYVSVRVSFCVSPTNNFWTAW